MLQGFYGTSYNSTSL